MRRHIEQFTEIKTFQELLENDNSVTVHLKNLQVLVTEMYKEQNNCLLKILNKVFPTNEPIYEYDLRNTSDFTARRIKTARYGSQSLSCLGPTLQDILPDEYKKLQSLKDFKAKIRSWVPENCPCRLCKIYIQHIGFIQGSSQDLSDLRLIKWWCVLGELTLISTSLFICQSPQFKMLLLTYFYHYKFVYIYIIFFVNQK